MPQSTMYGLATWMSAGVASGATLVGAAAVADPTGAELVAIASKTPDLQTSSIVLLISVMTYILRNSNEKTTAANGALVFESRNTLLDRLEAFASESRTGRAEITHAANQVEVRLSSQMAGIGAKVDAIKEQQSETVDKVDRLGDRMTKIETICDGRRMK